MANRTSSTTTEAAIEQMAEAGQCLVEMSASEGAAGNLSCFLASDAMAPAAFSNTETFELPLAVPELAHRLFIVTGSGTRMRDIQKDPGSCLGILEVQVGGQQAIHRYSNRRSYARLTSEFGSHLSVHRDHVLRHGLAFHAVVHAQPRKLTYLSHLPAYQTFDELNRRLLRWQPEAILNFPEGIAVVPFLVPGSRELERATEQCLREQRLVVWAKHGVVARSSASMMGAVDLIEYAETAATYECLDRSLGGNAEGLSQENLRAVAAAYHVPQRLF